ncbi:unnamed protein product [Owenia fusiformis]|uniref:Uncharacterized protein n=1 Tax=Owenia fusiformis TaxID=6347 RepID=A0A8J1XFZ4_OWEFU|nr:unnamed protein product [Owenia fusiformis]
MTQVPFWCSSRLGLAVIIFFGCLLLYAVRINLSVAMVCMVNHTALAIQDNPQVVLTNLTANATYNEANNTISDDDTLVCQMESGNGTTMEDGDFEWSKESQGHLFGAFFYGYMVSQFPGGYLAKKLGGKRVMGASMFITAICTLMTPIAARVSYFFILVLRVILGMCGGVVFPALHTVWANWAPPLETTKLVSNSYAGIYIGNVLTLATGGVLCKYGFDGGWPSIFYILGGFTVIWTVLWMVLTTDTPAEHKRISEVERDHIEKSIKVREGTQNDAEPKEEPPIPWCKMMTSPAVWAIIVSNTGCDWGGYTFLTNIPTYMKEVLKFDITSNGLYSCLPYLGMWAVINLAGLASDIVRRRGLLSTAWSRKVFDGIIGKMVPALFLIGLGFMNCTQQVAAVVLLTLGVSISGCQFSGFVVNHVDIAPRYAGILIGISNSIAACTGFIAPYVIGVITKDQTQGQWQIVFFISAAIYIITGIFYCIFASGEVQEWAKDKTVEDNELLPAKHAHNENAKLAATDDYSKETEALA